MRDFPAQVGPGTEPVSSTQDWTSSNANDTLGSIQETITSSGEDLIALNAPPDNEVLPRSISRYSSGAIFGVDSGTTNTYVISSSSSFVVPNSYFSGMIIIFKPQNVNTSASTINVFGIGVIDLLDPEGNALSANDLTNDRFYAFLFDGTAFVGLGVVGNVEPVLPTTVPNVIIFNTPGAPTYDKPVGLVYIKIQIVGAGGGGGAASTDVFSDIIGGGGGSGGYLEFFLEASALLASEPLTIGAGGLGDVFADGEDGEDTVFGTHATGLGGKGGIEATDSLQTGYGGLGGTTTTAIANAIRASGSAGFTGTVIAGNSQAGNGAPSFFGGGTRGGRDDTIGSPGGAYGAAGSGGSDDSTLLKTYENDGLKSIEEYAIEELEKYKKVVKENKNLIRDKVVCFKEGKDGEVTPFVSSRGGHGANGGVIITEYF